MITSIKKCVFHWLDCFEHLGYWFGVLLHVQHQLLLYPPHRPVFYKPLSLKQLSGAWRRRWVACWTLLGDGSNGMMYCSLFPYLLQSPWVLPDLTHISGQDYHLYVANYVGVATWKKICNATLAGWFVFLSRILPVFLKKTWLLLMRENILLFGVWVASKKCLLFGHHLSSYFFRLGFIGWDGSGAGILTHPKNK